MFEDKKSEKILENIVEKIKKTRKKLKLSQEKLAKKAFAMTGKMRYLRRQ